MKRILRLPSPAMVVACLALLIALGGTSYAAINLPRNSVGAKQLKRNAVTTPKVKANAITGAKVLESSLGQVPSAANATNATNASNATTAATATTAANASALNGYAANALIRGAGTTTGSVVVPASDTVLATVTLTVPTTGFVLVTASAGPRVTATCPCHFVMRLRDAVTGELSNYVVDTVRTTVDGFDGGAASTHLFPVTVTGPTSRTFDVIGYKYGTGTVDVRIDMTALWVPFGATGTSTGRPQGERPTQVPGKG